MATAEPVVNGWGDGEAVTVKDLVTRTGISIGTVRKAVDRLVTSGKVQDLGPDPDLDNPGRVPTLYRLAE